LQDALAADHDAWAIVGGSLHGRALLVTKGNTFLESALRLQPDINLYETTPDTYTASNKYDLTIFDGIVPKSLPGGALFFVNPPNGSYIFGQVGPQIRVSHLSAGNDTSNILNSVDISSIHAIRASHQITPTLWAQPILTAPETPLLVAGETNTRRVAVLGFDLHDSDLPLQPAFPILMFNVVNWFLPQPVAGTGQAFAGVPLTVQTWPGANNVIVTSPDKHATEVGPPFPVSPYTNTDQIGVYQVTQRVNGQDIYGAFAVNLFNPSQSQLAPATVLPIAHSTSFTNNSNTIPRELREIWPWIAAILLLILCFEWWLFSSNYRQQGNVLEGRKGVGRGNASTLLQPLNNVRQRIEANKDYKRFTRRMAKATKRFRHTSSLRSEKTKAKGDRHANI
jgi:hypothetical protein